MSLTRRSRGTPEQNDFETFWNLIKAGLVTISAAGSVSHPAFSVLSVGAEAISQVQGYFASRRSNELLQDVAADLYEAHRNHKLTMEQIQQVLSSEEFHSALLSARLIATRTHEEEKLKALRNAVLNVALGKESFADRQEQFMALVDRFTTEHLVLLQFFRDPTGYCQSYGKTAPIARKGTNLLAYQVLGSVMPTSREAGSLRELAVDELVSARLIGLKKVNEQWIIPRTHPAIQDEEIEPATTALGNNFLDFISDHGETK